MTGFSMTPLRDIALIYGSALILCSISELFFFNEGPGYSVIALMGSPGALLWHLFELGLWYSVVTAPMLWAIYHFNVSNVWGLFLTGCLFGYFTEGLVVPALYFPQSGLKPPTLVGKTFKRAPKALMNH